MHCLFHKCHQLITLKVLGVPIAIPSQVLNSTPEGDGIRWDIRNPDREAEIPQIAMCHHLRGKSPSNTHPYARWERHCWSTAIHVNSGCSSTKGGSANSDFGSSFTPKRFLLLDWRTRRSPLLSSAAALLNELVWRCVDSCKVLIRRSIISIRGLAFNHLGREHGLECEQSNVPVTLAISSHTISAAASWLQTC